MFVLVADVLMKKATFLVNETAKSAVQISNLWLAFEWIALSLKQQGPNPKCAFACCWINLLFCAGERSLQTTRSRENKHNNHHPSLSRYIEIFARRFNLIRRQEEKEKNCRASCSRTSFPKFFSYNLDKVYV